MAKVIITVDKEYVWVDYPDLQEKYPTNEMNVGQLGEMIKNLQDAGFEVPNPDFIF